MLKQEIMKLHMTRQRSYHTSTSTSFGRR